MPTCRSYQFYALFTIWPKEVRSDLRAGIKAKNQGDLEMSEKFLRRYASLRYRTCAVVNAFTEPWRPR